jgi:hypothetical protein
MTVLCTLPFSAAAIGPEDVVDKDPVSQPEVPEPPAPEPEPEPPKPQPPTPEPPAPEPPEEEFEDNDKTFQGEDKDPGDRNKTPVRTTTTRVPVTVPPSRTNTYPVPTRSNYCPAGLQPVTISGEISCGRPNQAMTYPQMLKHPQKQRVKKTRRVIRRQPAAPTCYAGTKGCSDR